MITEKKGDDVVLHKLSLRFFVFFFFGSPYVLPSPRRSFFFPPGSEDVYLFMVEDGGTGHSLLSFLSSFYFSLFFPHGRLS